MNFRFRFSCLQISVASTRKSKSEDGAMSESNIKSTQNITIVGGGSIPLREDALIKAAITLSGNVHCK